MYFFRISLLSFLAVATLKGAEKDPIKPPVPPTALSDAASLIAANNNLGPSATNFQEISEIGPREEDRVDPRVLRDFIESRGLIACRQKCGSLTIAGDARAKWTAAGEKGRLVTIDKGVLQPYQDNIKMRGTGSDTALNRFRSEFNLLMDYADSRSWVTTRVKFNTFCGVDGGSETKLELDRAFPGYDLYSCGDDEDFYIEVGRTGLDNVFDSRVEFGSKFDGIHLFYTNYYEGVGTFTLHGGPFIVDAFTNHYAWVVETSVEDWCDTGFAVKYSLIDWSRFARTKYRGEFDVESVVNGRLVKQHHHASENTIFHPEHQFT